MQETKYPNKDEKPSFILAVIIPFMGFPLLVIAAVLGIFFTLGMSLGLMGLSPLRVTIVFFPIGLFTYTIPYILYKFKGVNFRQASGLLGSFVLVVVVLFLISGGMSFLAPEICTSVAQNNATIVMSEFILRTCNVN